MTNLESLDLDAVTGGTLSPSSSAPPTQPTDLRLPTPAPRPPLSPTIPLGPFTPPSPRGDLA